MSRRRAWSPVRAPFADWPTFPQVYVDGELVGGCDITLELQANGDLQKMVKAAAAKWPADAAE